ncbi:MAG: ABC transporter transmembrane domain-containing protein, partial [bacterium]|nr:ABC transporter transmembrane domain-containing protein [bacterium]
MSKTNDLKRKRRKAQQTIRRYLGYYRRSLIVGGVCLVISNALLLVDPWILKISIDGLQEGITRQRLGLYAIVFVGVTVVSGVFRFLMRWIMIGASRRIEMDIRADFLSHLQTLSPSFYGANRTGDLMALATNDLNAVRALVGPGVMYSLNTVVVGGFALSLMVYLSWKLTIVSLLPMGFLAIGMYYSMKLIHQYFEKVQERFAELNSRAQENLSGIRVVKAYAREAYESAEFEKQSSIYMKANMKLFKIQSLLQPLLTSVAGLGALFV